MPVRLSCVCVCVCFFLCVHVVCVVCVCVALGIGQGYFRHLNDLLPSGVFLSPGWPMCVFACCALCTLWMKTWRLLLSSLLLCWFDVAVMLIRCRWLHVCRYVQRYSICLVCVYGTMQMLCEAGRCWWLNVSPPRQDRNPRRTTSSPMRSPLLSSAHLEAKAFMLGASHVAPYAGQLGAWPESYRLSTVDLGDIEDGVEYGIRTESPKGKSAVVGRKRGSSHKGENWGGSMILRLFEPLFSRSMTVLSNLKKTSQRIRKHCTPPLSVNCPTHPYGRGRPCPRGPGHSIFNRN